MIYYTIYDMTFRDYLLSRPQAREKASSTYDKYGKSYACNQKLMLWISFWIQKLIHNVSFWIQKLMFNVSFWMKKFWIQNLLLWISFWTQKLTQNISFWIQKLFVPGNLWFPLVKKTQELALICTCTCVECIAAVHAYQTSQQVTTRLRSKLYC